MINFIIFQTGWWSAAFLVMWGYANAAALLLFLLATLQFFILKNKNEIKISLLVGGLGYIFDFVASTLHLVHFEPEFWHSLPHPWLLGLWILFGTTVGQSLKWMFTHLGVAVPLGAIFGPLTYFFAGQEFGILHFLEPTNKGLILYGFLWAALTALIYLLVKKQPQNIEFDLRGKNVLVTGASRGIGLSLARALALKKTNLILVSRSSSDDLREGLLRAGAESVLSLKYDLTDSKEVDRLAAELQSQKIHIDVLINNAGLLTGGLLEDQNPDDIEKMMMVNTLSVLRLTRILLPQMLGRKSGRIVNNASVSGKMFFPCASTYAASKAAVVAFTESLKQELRGTGVSTLLLITPGVKTDMYDDISKQYGKNLDLSFMSHISSDEWAQMIVSAIQSGQDILWPKGSSAVGVRFAHHFPNAFETLVRSKFKR